MQSSPILFREESRPPRLLTWPLVFLGAGVLVSAVVGRLPQTQPALFAFYVFAGGFSAVFLLEFVAVAIEVTETEVRFRISPFYRHRIVIASIQHMEVKTYPSPTWLSRRFWLPPKHCVELATTDGARFTLILDNPERLSHAIAKAKVMHAGHETHSADHKHHHH